MTARPCKHPKTVSRYLRRAMPLDLRMRVGKREEKFSLAIENPGAAKRLHAVTRVELEQRQAALRVVPRRSSEPEAHERAALYDEHRIGLDRDEPRRQFFWRTALGDKLWPPRRGGWSRQADLDASRIRERGQAPS